MTTLFLLRCQSISPNSRGFFFLNFSLSPAFVIALSIKGQRNNSSSNIILLKNQKNGKQRVNKGGSCVNLSGLQLQDFVDLFAWDNLVFFFFFVDSVLCGVSARVRFFFHMFSCATSNICQKNRLCCVPALTWTSDHLLPSWAAHARPHFCINGWWQPRAPHSVTRGPGG